MNSKLSGSSVKFQGFGSGLKMCFVHDYISLGMLIRYQPFLLPETAKPGNEGFVKYFRIRSSRLPLIATFFVCYIFFQIVFGTTQFGNASCSIKFGIRLMYRTVFDSHCGELKILVEKNKQVFERLAKPWKSGHEAAKPENSIFER